MGQAVEAVIDVEDLQGALPHPAAWHAVAVRRAD
jgi:hypothetical protein